jgi:light-regulated signal transduction histidine kinase (bacteriophytochrome)
MDVTDRMRAEAEVQRLNLELEERVRTRTHELEVANGELEAFSYTVAHDLRAPLRHIGSFASLLMDDDDLPAPAKRNVESISLATRKMGKLIDDLLAFSRTARANLHVLEVDLNGLFADVQEECMRDSAGRTIDWQVDDLPPVLADAGLLRVVLVNLLSNAIKFTGRTEHAVIAVNVAPGEGREMILSVRDNGAGFDMQYAKKLFGVFQRLHHERDFPGTGIGLATVAKIIRRHGGRIWAESQAGKGATFHIVLNRA